MHLLEAAIEVALDCAFCADGRVNGKGLVVKYNNRPVHRGECSSVEESLRSSYSSSPSSCWPCFQHEEHGALFVFVLPPYLVDYLQRFRKSRRENTGSI